MPKKNQTHEITRSQISAIGLITLALVICTFALGYKTGIAQTKSNSINPKQNLLPYADEQASLEELIRQIESSSTLPAKDYIFHEELEAQRLPLGLSTDDQIFEKTTIKSDKNLNPPTPDITKLNLPTSGWAIQIGSFPSLDEAEELIAYLAEKELESYYVVALINGKNWYRVRIGGYNSRALAEKAKSSLSTRLGGTDYLVQKAP